MSTRENISRQTVQSQNHQLKSAGNAGMEYVILPSWPQTFLQEVGAFQKHVVAVFDWMFAISTGAKMDPTSTNTLI